MARLVAAKCQRPVGSAQQQPVELPVGDQQDCPLLVGQRRHPLVAGCLGEADAVAGRQPGCTPWQSQPKRQAVHEPTRLTTYRMLRPHSHTDRTLTYESADQVSLGIPPSELVRLTRIVGGTYAAFGLTLTSVVIFGLVGIVPKWGIGERALQRADLLVAMIAAITAAGLLSVSFLTDKFVYADGALSLTSDSDLITTASLVLLALLAGASGLLCALLGLVVMNVDWVRRWAGGCLVISSAAVISLFPAALFLLLSTADAAVRT